MNCSKKRHDGGAYRRYKRMERRKMEQREDRNRLTAAANV